MELRFIARAAKRMKLPSSALYQTQHRLSSNSSSPLDKSTQQAIPVGDYYSWILSLPPTPPKGPTPYSLPKQATKPPPENDPPPKVLDTNPATASNPDPAILFASRTVKLRERQEDKTKKSTQVAGIMIPPKPEEPDDCCMSGCVNCVWDRYQDEMEEYLGAKRMADKALLEMKAKEERGKDAGGGVATSMDDDGGGSESGWKAGDDVAPKSEDIFKDVPVGIREFMRLEKALKDKLKKA